MKKYTGLIILGIIVLVVAFALGWGVGAYNGFVELQANVEAKAADVDVALERRADLIPNLVSTVKGYAAHEEKVMNDITTARSNLLNANNMEDKAEANEQLTTALNALMVIVENYPNLKADTQFINLQDELAGTENRIAVARKDYNAAVKEYNTSIKKAPGNIIAGMFNFDDEAYFEVSEAKKDVPKVEF